MPGESTGSWRRRDTVASETPVGRMDERRPRLRYSWTDGWKRKKVAVGCHHGFEMLGEGFVIRQPQPHWGGADDESLHVVLFEPQIPGNTGNIARLCAGADVWLHLVRPLGYELDNRYLKRAGLDYWPHVKLCVHDSFAAIEEIFGRDRMWLYTKKATRIYTEADYQPGSVMIFGRETTGLDDDQLTRFEDRLLRIPITDKVRSLNLSNACAVVVYEALRQMQWAPLETT
jgi:tRNA (cytidine/uridine-2'-O-)-methyltransferase